MCVMCRAKRHHAEQAMELKLPLDQAIRCVGIPDMTRTVPAGCVVVTGMPTIVGEREVSAAPASCLPIVRWRLFTG